MLTNMRILCTCLLFSEICYVIDRDKVHAPVCDPILVCGHFFIFSYIDEANDKKPYDNHYKHYPE